MSEGGQVAGVGQGLPEDKAAVLAQAAAPPSPVRHPQEGQPPSAAPAPGEPSLGIAEAACELGSPPASGGTPGENAGQAASPQDTPGPRYKRGRGRSFFKEQVKKGAVCQVPDCDRSLHKLRDYYKRYKICPYHLELPSLVVEGQTIRFCQQCGRFQLLSDFEGDRRSCRRKLDKHNERRRKAEAELKARLAESGSDSPRSERAKAPRAVQQRPARHADAPGAHGDSHAQGTARQSRPSPFPSPGGVFGGGQYCGQYAGTQYGGSQYGGSQYCPPFGSNHSPQLTMPGAAQAAAVGGGLSERLQQLATDGALKDLQPALLRSLGDASWAGGQAAAAPLPAPLGPAQPGDLPQELMALLPADVQLQVMQQGSGILNSSLVSQLQHLVAPQQPQSRPSPAPRFAFGLFGSSGQTAAPQPPAAAPFHSPAAFGSGLAPRASLHDHLSGASLLQPLFGGQAASAAGAFMQPIDQQQQQQQQQPIPVLRSQPVQGGAREPAAGVAGDSDKAALLVALARTVGVSSEALAKALHDGGGAGGSGGAHGPSPGVAPPAQPAAPAEAPPAPLEQQLLSMLQQLVSQQQQQQQPQQPQQQQPQQQPQRQQPDAMQVSPTTVHGPLGGSSPPSLAMADSSRPGSDADPPPAARSSSSGQQQASSGRNLLDLEQLQGAVQHGGLSAGFASDASLLLQLVAAVESAQQRAGGGGERMRSLSLKLFNCTPDRLPKNILEQLEEWMVQNKSLLEGASRPGCVQLGVSALLSAEEHGRLAGSFGAKVQQLARQALADLRTGVLAQLGTQAALVDRHGRCVAQLDLAGGGAELPQICSVRPLVVPPGYGGPILVTGRHLGAPHDTIYCRSGGTYPTTEVLGRGALLPGAEGQAADLSWVLLRIPNLEEGCHRVEAQRGVFVSPPHSLLVLRDAAAAAELLQLEWADSCVGDAPELLHRLGAVLGFARRGAWRADAALQRRVASAAQELAATCIVQRWPAVLRLVLPLTSCGCSVAAAVEGVERHLGGIPVLHAAALLGGPDVVRTLGLWADGVRLSLPLDKRWGGGLTALHIAVLLAEGAEDVALALTDLAPADALELWCSARAAHGNESPVGLACRLGREHLLAALAARGVAEAGAMLAALRREQEPEATEAASPPQATPPQRLTWLRELAAASRELLRAGEAGSSSVLPPLGQAQGAERPPPTKQVAGEAFKCEAHGCGGTCETADEPGCSSGGCGCDDGGRCYTAELKGGVPAHTEPTGGRVWRRGQALRLCQSHTVVCAVLATLLVAAMSMAPPATRNRTHAWLLVAVSRAPLLLQPVLLLCAPVCAAYRGALRNGRYGMLAGLHVSLFVLQWCEARACSGAWLGGSAALEGHVAGMWVRTLVLLLQLRAAAQSLPLTASYVAHAALLPLPHSGGLAACARPHLPICLLFGGARISCALAALMFLVGTRRQRHAASAQ